MKIAIDIRSTLKKKRTGVGQYTYNLLKNLAAVDDKNEYSLYVKKRLFSVDKKLPDIQARNFKFKVDRFSSGLDKTLGKVDVFHTPSQDLLNVNDAKIVVTVHDLIFKTFPAGHSKDALIMAEKQILNVIDKADRIICYSQSTINDLKLFYRIKDDKVSLIYVGIDRDVFYPIREEEKESAKAVLRQFGIKDKFILFVGTIEPRKNIGNLILAFNKLKKQNKIEHKLVVIGMKGWLYEKIFELYNKSEFKDDIIFLDYQPNNTLRNFYNLASVFVYPSFYEGFGFPILEAYSCAAPVVTSNISSCREIGEGAALLIDPNSVDDLSEKILRILDDNRLSDELRQKGLEKSKMFSWEATAKKTLDIYKEVLGQ